MAKDASKIWKKCGALSYYECMGDDLTAPVPMLSFAKLAKAKETDTVWFSFITFKSRAHRDQVNKKLMAHWEKDAAKNPDKHKDMPFDMRKMAYGGFKVVVKD
jgi:alkaline phosphatase